MALLADVQYGFPGEITPTAWAQIIGAASGGVYGVGGGNAVSIGELKLSPNGVGDRGALLSTGLAYGHGCIGVWNSTTQFNFAAPSGTNDRWDCVVIRRTWSNTPGASVTTLAVITGTSSKTLPALQNTPGTVTEQPLWLVRVKGGQTSVQELVDLRCFAANGGVQAMHSLALGYLANPGSRVEVDGLIYEYRANAGTTSVGWEVISGISSIPMFGVGGALSGNASAAPNGQFLIQAGSLVQRTDASGYARITWPKAFPNGLLTVLLANGDSWSTAAVHLMVEGNTAFWGSSGTGNKENVVYMARSWVGSNEMAKNVLHRVNYIAIGF